MVDGDGRKLPDVVGLWEKNGWTTGAVGVIAGFLEGRFPGPVSFSILDEGRLSPDSLADSSHQSTYHSS
jgi:hypothetical protein